MERGHAIVENEKKTYTGLLNVLLKRDYNYLNVFSH